MDHYGGGNLLGDLSSGHLPSCKNCIPIPVDMSDLYDPVLPVTADLTREDCPMLEVMGPYGLLPSIYFSSISQ